jgi:hypothetical protein
MRPASTCTVCTAAEALNCGLLLRGAPVVGAAGRVVPGGDLVLVGPDGDLVPVGPDGGSPVVCGTPGRVVVPEGDPDPVHPAPIRTALATRIAAPGLRQRSRIGQPRVWP